MMGFAALYPSYRKTRSGSPYAKGDARLVHLGKIVPRTDQIGDHSEMSRNPLYSSMMGAALATVFASQSAIAVQNEDINFDTTEDLYQVCSVEPGAPEYIVASFACRGFIEAAVQYHDEVSDRKNLKRLICYPKSATVADGRAAFVVWAKKHSGDDKLMNEVPVVGLVRALAEKYPCK